ncbi:MFS transporter [Pedobacter gandavensis]|uniref:MFS transporter n=1 Tax=Pedobacter gandavensis TaxID=2679963 RepID=A0ABR6ESB3_9SPHI|nr:MFS transporter [Pedobacter gandavensis]MBB2148121.1 MFS transporter [Pedobacter gandavensis]
MTFSEKTPVSSTNYRGTDRLILGIVLAVITFWLFAQTTLNIAPTMSADLNISNNINSIAVSITALFSGIFIVVAGGLADRIGRLKITNIGLLLSIIGSLLIVVSPSGTAVFLLAGRIFQGLSAACIMPATLALMKTYFDGKERQRALSFWSIGSWGGSGLCSLFGGFVASTIGWRWIFIISIVVAIISYLILRGTPESKVVSTEKKAFDWPGLIAFIIAMLALNIVIGQGSGLGWLSSPILVGVAVFIISAIAFFIIDGRSSNGFVDLSLFKNKTYSGATLSNFLLNGAAGTLLVSLTLVQEEAGLSSLQSGLITVGYLVAILSTIRVGEKLLQKLGPRKPMLLGCLITGFGILLTSLTFLLAKEYIITAFIGFTFFGIGLGFYATPSTDAALSSIPDSKAGTASGIYKMASSLGAAFGVAISAAIFYGLSHSKGISPMAEIALGRTDNVNVRYAAAIALLFNVFMVAVAIIAILYTVPKSDSKTAVK